MLAGAWDNPGMQFRRTWLFAAVVPACAFAQVVPEQAAKTDARTLDSVEVLGQRRALSSFPGAIDVLDGEMLRDGQRQVNLSESLQRVPGITVLDRQNYAQDLQIQSRGFGARSTFGIRGIKLIVDGIPSSAADGQGQAASFPIDSLDRIEVLRGPLALQYGNAAGGAIVGYSELDGEGALALDAWAGSDSATRAAARIDGANASERLRWRAHASHFRTEGARPHSAAERTQFSAVTQWTPREGERLRLVLNSLTQPDTQDPLGLTREDWQRDPHGTDPAARLFDTRKRIDNHQLGVSWQRDYAPGREVWVNGYGVRRDVVQFLSIPVSAQLAPSSAGGVIDIARRSTGVELGHRWRNARGALAAGLALTRLDEARRGYENFVGSGAVATQLGVRGRLRRDEDNRVNSREAYVIGDLALAPAWTLLGALRHARLDFVSDDHYVVPGNGDDSGRSDYRETAASLGIARAFGQGEVFASVGRGFETPTITESAYRPDGGTGFNRDLGAASFLSAEVGARWRFAHAKSSVALYRIDGDDEIVPAQNSGGRSSFANAGGTRRDGIELGVDGRLGQQWSYALAANAIRARFEQSFSYRVNRGPRVEVQVVAAGNRIPGIPRADGFAELAWHSRDDRFNAALEARISARIATDDRNSDAAPGHARFALRAQWRPMWAPGWHGFARINNVLDRDTVGSVIVNDGNGRYFEPGAPRTFTLGLGWRY